jgi:hypothetical protein
MDIIYDLFTLRNVNRPYTDKELEDLYKKDHSIQEENKQSRLKRCVSFNDPDYDNVSKEQTDNNQKASSSSVKKVGSTSTDTTDTTFCDDQ